MPYRRKCRGCGVMFETKQPAQKYHNARCVNEHLHAPRLRTIAAKGLAAARVKRDAARAARWAKTFPGVSLAALQAVYLQGYQAGHVKGRDHGYREGWRQALGEQRDVA